MPTEYLEINSQYRDRSQYPLASDFIVRIAQSGSKNARNSVDPVCQSSVGLLSSGDEAIFVPFVTASADLTPTGGTFSSSSSGTTVVFSATAGDLSHIFDYYSGATIGTLDPTANARIVHWSYINTAGGSDFFQAQLTSSLSPATYTIYDPTDFSDINIPLVFIPSSQSSDNFYINQIIFNQTKNEWLPIEAFDGITHVAALDTTNSSGHYTGPWDITDTLTLRAEAPAQYGNNISIQTSTTGIIVPLGPGVSANVYIGSFLRVLSTPPQYVRITAFNTATDTVTVYPAFTAPGPYPVSVAYEFLPFSYDNEGFLSFNNSSAAIREAVCYDISLMNIILPSATLTVSRGSHIVFYPYIYVEFRSEKNSDGQGANALISNDPNARRMLFRATAGDNEDVLINPFLRLSGDGTVQRIKLDPLSSYRFAVHLPDGSFFQTEAAETTSPLPPNPLAQISALFSITRASS
jgi:hypothetical protein